MHLLKNNLTCKRPEYLEMKDACVLELEEWNDKKTWILEPTRLFVEISFYHQASLGSPLLINYLKRICKVELMTDMKFYFKIHIIETLFASIKLRKNM